MNPTELRDTLQGMIVAQFCPYDPDGSVDLDGLRENTEHLVEFADDGKDLVLLANGSTGENYANSQEESRSAIETVVEASGDLPVLAGTGGTGTRETINTTRAAAEAGADGALVVTPYYRSATEQGLVEHYEQVAKATDLGLVAYYNSDVSGARIPPNVLEELAAIDGLVGLKDGTPLVGEYYEMTRRTDPDDIRLLCSGPRASYVAKSALGNRYRGFFSVTGNFAPELDYELYEAVEARDFDRAYELLGKQDDFWNLVGAVDDRREATSILPAGWGTNHMFLPVGKAAMDLMGLNGGGVRLPEVDLTEAERDELEDVLGTLGVY